MKEWKFAGTERNGIVIDIKKRREGAGEVGLQMTAVVEEKLVFGQWEGVRKREVKKEKTSVALRSGEWQETESRENRTEGFRDRGGPIALPPSLSDQPY